MLYNIADLIVEYDSKYNILKERSNKYLIKENNKRIDFKIDVNEREIEKLEDSNQEITSELAEYILTGIRFYKNLLEYKGCLLHSSAVVIDNESYLFSATSGTGKSTHTKLWMKYLANKNPYILNDDKPAIRIIDNEIWTYGTPFSGVDDISENKKVKLKAICFIERSETNSIERIKNDEAIKLMLEQTLNSVNGKRMMKFLEIADIILKQIPIYKLKCNMTEEAVKLAYKTMKEGKL